ncbi:hypothetical protein [Maribellus mangrovi]|uniref:hypothetical protein n=1 Tax=Maribellus mangrovi TaxID=3133146 RepID=UPI0030EE389B
MKSTINDNDKKYPKGYFLNLWMGICIAVFSGVGIPIAIISKNFAFIGIGPAIGVSVGIAIGQGIENKQEKEGRIRPLTNEEKRNAKRMLILGIALLFVLAILGVIFSYE